MVIAGQIPVSDPNRPVITNQGEADISEIIFENLKGKGMDPEFFFRTIFARWVVIWIRYELENNNQERKVGV